jgi:hypothetical protein
MSTALELQPERPLTTETQVIPLVQMTPVQMAYQLISSGADFASVKEMMALSKELAADQARRAFDEAVASAKAGIPTIAKNAKGHNNKAYANFAAYAEALKDVLAEHGLSYRFRTEQTDRITVTCVLSHKGGHSEENSLSGPADNSGSKNAIQAIGSTLTYLQRYTLIQALGLAASDDDDGEKHGKDEEQLRTISEEQQMQIREMLDATDSDEAQFLKLGNLQRLADMPASQFQSAMNILRQRLAKRGAA